MNHLINPIHLRLNQLVMKQHTYSGHPDYLASIERQFLVWLRERLEKDLWTLGFSF